MPRRDLVRIVLVGDDGVGKSSIITSLIKESFVSNVQPVVPEVTIPPEVTPENVTTSIVDTSSNPKSRPHLLTQLTRAHVICLVYSISEPTSFDRVAEYWLPLFRREGVNVPVILVGNKIDLRGGEVTNQGLEDEIAPIMREFKEVETVVECSALLPLNVSEVFYFAQKAVLHPTAPLYDSREHTLKPKCLEALQRIFKISDVDKDGLLNAHELNQFQQKCFSAPLQTQELEGILDLVRAHDPTLVAPVPMLSSAPTTPIMTPTMRSTSLPRSPSNLSPPAEGITETGFLYLHTIFIQQGRMETTWTVLRNFGYGEGLDLREDFLLPKYDVPSDCSVELSPLGNQFFTDIFEAYDKDQDGALSTSELNDLFSTSPGNPWLSQGFPETTITDELGRVTLQGWLAQWSMTTLLNHRTTLNYLAYLGYSSSPATDLPASTALKITRPRRQDRRQRKVTRSVFLCFVLGATGSGKTSLLRSFVGRRLRGGDDGMGGYEPTTKVLSVVNSVEMEGVEKYLVLQEFGSKYESETLRNSKKLDMADIIIYVHDSSDTNSFSYISNLRQQYSLDHIPAIFVATKSDLDLAQQRHEVQPDVYCRRLGLPAPMAVSARGGPMSNLWVAVTRVALNPTSSIPKGPSSVMSPAQRVRSVATIGLGATTAATILGLWMRYQGYTFRGLWLWISRTTGMFSGTRSS
ncbi:P-loop containing nucleoside triphosphate hydrolase protein [Kockovaella imperatae]|uniref:Mitochondrial Rho GTPase n=1 Tax=Kockovaella imperatae TaxID=4999 RepID=A0A1Y1UNA0_9TREE|nr:P-loop containing nucleoside triphosphate hydrolase protein [Kockovaella imperatae]ORX38936.1 P-loop containing nucleoside triphosphate hydrolase protein [Kockovaella imperatae]